jgi:hypothetical protein
MQRVAGLSAGLASPGGGIRAPGGESQKTRNEGRTHDVIDNKGSAFGTHDLCENHRDIKVVLQLFETIKVTTNDRSWNLQDESRHPRHHRADLRCSATKSNSYEQTRHPVDNKDPRFRQRVMLLKTSMLCVFIVNLLIISNLYKNRTKVSPLGASL